MTAMADRSFIQLLPGKIHPIVAVAMVDHIMIRAAVGTIRPVVVTIPDSLSLYRFPVMDTGVEA
jgi:hypothetical protein